MTHLIFGCGDVGRRIVRFLIASGVNSNAIKALVNTESSKNQAGELGINADIIDLDNLKHDLKCCHQANVYYTVAPQKSGFDDLRSKFALDVYKSNEIIPNKVILISTTGVYGNYDGEWVDEFSETKPVTGRGKRRLSSELQWLQWGGQSNVPVTVLRAPGIYAHSRIPRDRIAKRIPVVAEHECGFTNRIHADDLARACILAMQKASHAQVFNATDGKPGKITEYLQAAACVIDLPPLPEISMQQAKQELSAGMLSYLSESRKISNRRLLDELGFELLYADFKKGLLH